MQQATQIWDVRLTRNTIATRGVGPEARRPRSKPESILLSAFLYPPFALLLLRFSVPAGEKRAREGHLPRGRIIHCPVVPKEAEPNTKAAVIAILHSPPQS